MALVVGLLSTTTSSQASPESADATTSTRGTLVTPFGVALAGDRVYVTDFDANRVEVFTRDGAWLASWGVAGSGPGEFHGPAGIAIDRSGFVYVADFNNHRIQKFSAAGSWIASFGERGSGAHQLGGPFGMALDRNGSILVTEIDNHRIHRFSSDGTSQAVWGSRGTGAGELEDPWGIAVDERGVVYVADHGNDRIARFAANGAWLGSTRPAGALDWRGPTSLALGSGGSLYLGDLRSPYPRLLDPDGTLHSLAEGPPGAGSLVTSGFAVDAGEVFVANVADRRVERIAVPASGVHAGAPPSRFEMEPADPTPSAGRVTMRFRIPARGDLDVEIFSVDGRRIHRTPLERCEPGVHTLTWDARDEEGRAVPAGVYFARVRFDDSVRPLVRTGRIVVLR